jgi:hypothetical protein
MITEYLDKIISLPFFIPKSNNSELISKMLEIEVDYSPEDTKNIKSNILEPVEMNNVSSVRVNIESGKIEENIDETKKNIDIFATDSIKIDQDEKYYIKEIIEYLDDNLNSSFTPRQIIQFTYTYKLFKYVLGKNHKGILCSPQILAWWLGLVLKFPDEVYCESIDNNENEDLKTYFNDFSQKSLYDINELYKGKFSDLLKILQKESAILVEKKTIYSK